MANIKVRVGQQNTVKVVSSLSGASSSQTTTAENVIGGIGSITELYVSGISTFGGVSTFEDDVFFNGNITFDSPIEFDSFTTRDANVTGIATVYNANIIGVATVTGELKFASGNYESYGISYFQPDGKIVSLRTPGTGHEIDYTNYILTTDDSDIPVWSNAIDGGSY